MNQIDATFVSVWNGGVEIRTPCVFDPVGKEVISSEVADVEGLESLDEQFVEYEENGKTVKVTRADGLILDTDEEYTRYVLVRVKVLAQSPEDAEEIINEADYSFVSNREQGNIADTEIMEVYKTYPSDNEDE